MKLSEFFRAPFLRSLAIRVGVFVGIGVWIFTEWNYGVLIGAIVTLLTSLILPVIFYVKFLPYERMKRVLKRPFLLDEPVRFTVKKGTVGGFFILTEKSMIFLSRECENNTLELTHAQVQSVRRGHNFTINIYLNNTQFIRLFSNDSEAVLKVLREQGWNVAE